MCCRPQRVSAAGRFGGGVRRPADGRPGRAHRGRRRDRGRRAGRHGLRHPPAAAAGRRRGADRAPRRGAGRGDREGPRRGGAPALGRRDEPERDPGAAPGRRLVAALGRGQARDGVLHAQSQARGAAQADAAAVPQPRQLRGERRGAQPLAGGQGRGDGRLRPHRDDRQQAARRGRQGRRRPHGRQGPRQVRGREGQLRARQRRHGPGHRARRGLLGASHRRRGQGAGPRRQGPAGVGPGREGGLGDRAAVREGRAHARLAAARGREVEGVRRLLDLRHEP